jgi:hypothetical protein
MARAGVPVGTIQAWMADADLATTQLYMHYALAQQDAARIEAAFGPTTAIEGSPAHKPDGDAA